MPRDIIIFCHSKNFKKIYPAISEKSCEQKREKKLDSCCKGNKKVHLAKPVYYRLNPIPL